LEIDIEEPTVNEKLKTDWEESFEAEYNELYGKVDDENPIELASIRVYVSQPVPHLDIAKPTATMDAEPKSLREVYVSSKTGTAIVPVYERTDLCIGQLIMGPAIVEERESTTVIGDGDKLTVNNRGCLEVDLAESFINENESDDQSINTNIGES
jgi:N-methylhydantoinase A